MNKTLLKENLGRPTLVFIEHVFAHSSITQWIYTSNEMFSISFIN